MMRPPRLPKRHAAQIIEPIILMLSVSVGYYKLQ